MDYKKEVVELFGSANFDTLLEACKNGKQIDKEKLKAIAKAMHSHVHGVFVQRTKYTDVSELQLANVMRYMLDSWYLQELYMDGVNGLEKLLKVLDDVGLSPLAQKMKSSGQTTGTGKVSALTQDTRNQASPSPGVVNNVTQNVNNSNCQIF